MESLKCFIFGFEFKIMKRYLLLLATALILSSCDDGDIIVSDFNFDLDSELTLCEFQFQNSERRVLHIITESNEAISFTFEENIMEKIDNVIQPEDFSIPINSTNRINYRRLDANVNSDDYFCQQIPPSQPRVLEEFVSTTGGSVEFTITRETGPNVDTDGDGVLDINERRPGESVFELDTDGDGIPNFLDIDDDNDNVLTNTERTESAEFNRIPDENDVIDTDGDGIPNYLDDDDDGDGVITRYEDLNAFDDDTENPTLNPENSQNEEGVPNYLDPNSRDSLVVDFFIPNTISRKFRITVVFNNITLNNTDSERTIRFNSQGFGSFNFDTNNETIDPR